MNRKREMCVFSAFRNFYLTTANEMNERKMLFSMILFPCDWILMTFAIKNHSFIHGSARNGIGKKRSFEQEFIVTRQIIN
jgi:hypothetical protein